MNYPRRLDKFLFLINALWSCKMLTLGKVEWRVYRNSLYSLQNLKKNNYLPTFIIKPASCTIEDEIPIYPSEAENLLKPLFPMRNFETLNVHAHLAMIWINLPFFQLDRKTKLWLHSSRGFPVDASGKEPMYVTEASSRWALFGQWVLFPLNTLLLLCFSLLFPFCSNQ